MNARWRSIAVTCVLVNSLWAGVQAHAYSGPGDRGGNGGEAEVCRDAQGVIESVRILDLVEEDGPEIVESSLDSNEQVSQALDRLRDSGLAWAEGAIWQKIIEIRRRLRPVGNDFNLEFTRDAHSSFEATGLCRREQLAVYRRDTHELQIRGELYRHLSPTQLAGFELHESAYAVESDRHWQRPPNSDAVRAFVRALLHPRSTPALVREKLNFRAREVSDFSFSFARALLARAPRPLTCAPHCELRDLEGDYFLTASAPTSGNDCSPATRIKVGEDSLQVLYPFGIDRKWAENERYGLDHKIKSEAKLGQMSITRRVTQKDDLFALQSWYSQCGVFEDNLLCRSRWTSWLAFHPTAKDELRIRVTTDGAIEVSPHLGEASETLLGACRYERKQLN